MTGRKAAALIILALTSGVLIESMQPPEPGAWWRIPITGAGFVAFVGALRWAALQLEGQADGDRD